MRQLVVENYRKGKKTGWRAGLEFSRLESSISVEWMVYLLFNLLTLDPTMSDSSAREELERPTWHQLLYPEVSLTSQLHDDASAV